MKWRRSRKASMNPPSTSKNWCARTRCCWPIARTSCARRWRAFAWGWSACRAPIPRPAPRLARSIAELDALIGEMLLSSRLDVASGIERAEPVDLLALAAEEAAHFDRRSERRRGDHQRRCDAAAPAGAQSARKRACSCGRRHRRSHRRRRAARAHRGRRCGRGRVRASDRDRIFEPFYRAHRPPRSRAARAWGSPSSDRSRARTAARWSTRRARVAAAASR